MTGFAALCSFEPKARAYWLCFALACLSLVVTQPALAQPLASDEAAADQLDAVERAQHMLDQRFAALAFDDASWQSFQQLCSDCESPRPDPKQHAPALPQDPLGPLDLQILKAQIADQEAAYDAALWQDASISSAGLERYQQRCIDCVLPEDFSARAKAMQEQQADWAQDRANCQSVAAPKQYGGQHRWHQDRSKALTLCQEAYDRAPNDPWRAFLLWRSQAVDAKEPDLLAYAVRHAVAPALAAAAWQHLENHLPARKLAEKASRMGDLNGLVILALLDKRDGRAAALLTEDLAPALEADHPWALRLAAELESSSALKVAYLQLAINQGDRRAQAEQLRAWESNLGSATNRERAARAHILAVAEGSATAKTMWYDNGDQRPNRLVKAVQGELIALGHLSGAPDGIWGKNSEAALRQVDLAEIAAWRPKSVDSEPEQPVQSAATSSEPGPEEPGSAEPGSAEPEQEATAASEAQDSSPDNGLNSDPDGVSEAQAAQGEDAPTATALVAPLPKPKGKLATAAVEEKAKPKKRGTFFFRKAD